jgi:hypothetical protein
MYAGETFHLVISLLTYPINLSLAANMKVIFGALNIGEQLNFQYMDEVC